MRQENKSRLELFGVPNPPLLSDPRIFLLNHHPLFFRRTFTRLPDPSRINSRSIAEKSATRRSNTALRVGKHFPNDPVAVAQERGTGARVPSRNTFPAFPFYEEKKPQKGAHARWNRRPSFPGVFSAAEGVRDGSAVAKLERNSIVRARGLETLRRDFFKSRRTERDGTPRNSTEQHGTTRNSTAGRRSSVSVPLLAPSFSAAPSRRLEFSQFPRSPRDLRSSEQHAPLCPAISSQHAESTAPFLVNEIIVDRRGFLGAEEYISS